MSNVSDHGPSWSGYADRNPPCGMILSVPLTVAFCVGLPCTPSRSVEQTRSTLFTTRKNLICSKRYSCKGTEIRKGPGERACIASDHAPLPGEGEIEFDTRLRAHVPSVKGDHCNDEKDKNSLSEVPAFGACEEKLEKTSHRRGDEEPYMDTSGNNYLWSASLQEYREQREAGLLSPVLDPSNTEWSDAWALALDETKAQELMNQYSRVGILIDLNFPHFQPTEGNSIAFNDASIDEIARAKAKAVYEATGLPAIGEMHDLSIDAPESGSRINKTLQQRYYTKNVTEEADAMINRVRPISDENRMTRFTSVVVYFDGEMELRTSRRANVAMVYSGSQYATVATTAALDDMYKELSKRLGLTLDSPGKSRVGQDGETETEQGKVLVAAALLKERILRDGKMLGDSIIKVSSFLNHMVDTELMEMCGEELAERLRHTMPNKVLTVESTGLIAGLPTARKLGIPLVFARKSRPITISDSYQTTYRSATKGTTSELIVSCEYLEAGDRVVIIDDFLAGGSTAEALFKLAKMAHAKVVGVGVLIEKMSDGGRTFLSGYDVPVESLAKLLPDGDKGRITFVEEGPWMPPNLRLDKRSVQQKMINAEAEYYSRMGDESGLPVASPMKRSGDTIKGTDDGDDNDCDDGDIGDVDVIRWEDDEEDLLDAMEENLIQDSGRL